MIEPLLEEEKSIVKYFLDPANVEDPNFKYTNDFKYIKVDQFASYVCQNQMKRLVKYMMPKQVGLRAIGVNLNKDGRYIMYYDHDFSKSFEDAYFNPNTKVETIEGIKLLLMTNPEYFIKLKNRKIEPPKFW